MLAQSRYVCLYVYLITILCVVVIAFIVAVLLGAVLLTCVIINLYIVREVCRYLPLVVHSSLFATRYLPLLIYTYICIHTCVCAYIFYICMYIHLSYRAFSLSTFVSLTDFLLGHSIEFWVVCRTAHLMEYSKMSF